MAQDARNTEQPPTSHPTVSNSTLSPDQPHPGVTSPARTQPTRPVESNDASVVRWKDHPLRTIPAWIRSYDIPDNDADATTRLLPSELDDAHVAQHNHSPYSKDKRNVQAPDDEEYTPRESRWTKFTRSAAYPRVVDVSMQEKRVSWDWLNNNLGDYSQPWGASRDGSDLERGSHRTTWKAQRRRFFDRFQTNLLRSPIVPLVFRLTVWIFSLCALVLGGVIQHLSDEFGRPQGPSAIMAIVTDAVALVYLVYITYDEYTSKPLGLRSPKAKMRLILLDIVFIVFDSANLSLAFESLSDVQGACTVATINEVIDDRNDAICDRQRALASVLLIALIAWLLTFTVSVFRLVERVSSR